MLFYYKIKDIKTFSIGRFGLILFTFSFWGCKKFVEINPPITAITASTAYNNNTSAAAVMTGIYSNMIYASGGLSGGNASVSTLEGLAADELTNYSANVEYIQFYQNELSSQTSGISNTYFWQEIYQQIHVVNAEIEGVASSRGVTPLMRKQLDGEAKFIRAFYLFYAVNLYGDAPLVTTADFPTNNSIKRTSKIQVYQQIIKDLKDSKAELSTDFVDGSGIATPERVRPNKGAAEALLARVYLYTEAWPQAEAEADSLINDISNYALLPDLGQVFQMNSQESIWQLAPNSPGYNTWDAYYFVLTSPPGSNGNSFALSSKLVKAFEPNDARFDNWVGLYQQNGIDSFYFPYKYKVYLTDQPVSEYLTVFRLAEQYLIRSEARAHGAGVGIAGAIADLNTIRSRANLPGYSGPMIRDSVLASILHERQVELFTEWGHRWFDLIRTRNINLVMGSPGNVCQAKGGSWNANDTLAPLPFYELQINPNLAPQNPGYN